MIESIPFQTALSYDDCLKILWGRGHELHGEKFGLEPIKTILAALDSPERRYPTAIVAGTNGKGSTSAMLAAILQKAGYRTGFYSSPHLVRVNERIRIDGFEVSDEEFAAAFAEVYRAVESLIESKELPHRPSFFEFLTATAFQHFSRASVDFAVLEVGMGGRLDATNVTDASVAVITNVDLDHQQFLGNTHAAIAGEKAGVIKPGRPVVSSCEHSDVVAVLHHKSSKLGAELIETGGLRGASNLFHLDGRYGFDLEIKGCALPGLTLKMAGRFQVKNAIAAATAATRLAQSGFHISPESIREGLRVAVWPGRLETVRQRPLVMLDGAHNPAAAREVARFYRQHLEGRKLRMVYASMRDKDIGEISRILFPLANTVYLTRPSLDRAATPEVIMAAVTEQPGRMIVEPDPARALEQAVYCSMPEDVVLVAGSLFLVGAVKKAIFEGRLDPAKLTPPEVFSEHC